MSKIENCVRDSINKISLNYESSYNTNYVHSTHQLSASLKMHADFKKFL